MFSLRESRRGGDKLRTHVYLSNLAPIAAKLRENAFQTICNFRFFDAEIFFAIFFRIFFSVFHRFRQILEELGIFGRQNQIPGGILLQIDKFSGLYDAWRSFLDFSPSVHRPAGGGGSNSDAPTTERAGATGRGRGGVVNLC